MDLNTRNLHKEEDDLHHFHVLAVDDSLIDRMLLEKLLQVSSCKGTDIYPSFFFFTHFSLGNLGAYITDQVWDVFICIL